MKNPLLDKEVLEGLLKISETTFNTILSFRQKKKEMSNNTELEQILINILEERNSYVLDYMKGQPGLNLSISDMGLGFIFQKLAEFEARLRLLEKGNARTQSFIGRNTPLK
jgi:hypothetical protein